jgi:hypothetical protein
MFGELGLAGRTELIAQAADVVTISKRLGHAKPSVTLAICAHMFTSDDRKAADAINPALSPQPSVFGDRWVAIGWQSSHLFY